MLSLRYYVTKVCIITIISSLVSHFLKLSFSHVFVYRNEMFMHMEANHGKFYSHMCGPPRPYQCSVCRRTMETEVIKLRNNS